VLTRLPPVALVMAAQDLDLDAEPEEGTAGQLARAMDSLHGAEKRLARAEELKLEDETRLTAIREKLEVQTEPPDENARAEQEKELARVEVETEKSFRKAAKEQAKHNDAMALVMKLSEDNS
jgi:hypothetical protein